MPSMIERMAEAMYWERVNPNRGAVTLSVAVMEWSDLADEHRSGLQVWHCKAFWRAAARAAIETMREPTAAMLAAGAEAEGDEWSRGGDTVKIPYQAMIDAALSSPGDQ